MAKLSAMLLALYAAPASAYLAPSLCGLRRSAQATPCGSARARHAPAVLQHSQGWDGFGKGPFKFYNNFDSFMSPFPDEDREQYPEMFAMPKGVFEVAMPKPLGIAFEEQE